MTLWFLAIAVPLTMAQSSIADMTWQRRVLLISAPSGQDPAAREQRAIIARWRAQGEARDLSVVELMGDRVVGATDTAAALRDRYRLPTTGFTAVLIGKDGGEKLRDRRPLTASLLERTIDSMPMRRGGGR